MQISLVISMRFIFGIFHFVSDDVTSLKSMRLNFRVFIHAYVYGLRPQTYLPSSLTRVLNQFEYDVKSKYPEEYWTFDKEGGEKALESKSCFV